MPPQGVTQLGDDHPSKGIGSMVLAMFLVSVGDAGAKWLGQEAYMPFQIALFRFTFGLLPVAAFVWYVGIDSLKTRRPIVHMVRACLLFAALSFFYTALRALPLAEAIALGFTTPLFVTVLSYPVLGERVGARRAAAVVVGFVGTLIILQPGTDAFRSESLIVLLAAICLASALLLTRQMSRTETNIAMLTYTTLGAAIISLPLASFGWRPPDNHHLWIFMGMGLFGTVGNYFMITAFKHAPAAVVIPFEYTTILWATLFGWLLWRERPEAVTWIGVAVIVLAGIYTAHRETQIGRRSGTSGSGALGPELP